MARKLGDKRPEKERLREERALEGLAYQVEYDLRSRSFYAKVAIGFPPMLKSPKYSDIGFVVLVLESKFKACEAFLNSHPYCLSDKPVKVYCFPETETIELKLLSELESKNIQQLPDQVLSVSAESLDLNEFDDDDDIYFASRPFDRELWLQKNVDST
jgi:hypothetical protein